MATTQSSQEVINHHAQALGTENLEEIVADYSDHAVFIGSGRRSAWQGRHPPSGHQAPQQGAAGHLDIKPLSTVLRDGLIWVQTASATAAARSLTGGKCHAPGC